MGMHHKRLGHYQIAHQWFLKSHKMDKTLGGELQAQQIEELAKEEASHAEASG
jgi:hypothetical protein